MGNNKGWKIFGILVILVVIAGFAYWYFTKDKKPVAATSKKILDAPKAPPVTLDPATAVKEYKITNFKPGEMLYRDGDIFYGELSYWSGQMGSLQETTDSEKGVPIGKYVKTTVLSQGNITNYLVQYVDDKNKNWFYPQKITNVYALR